MDRLYQLVLARSPTTWETVCSRRCWKNKRPISGPIPARRRRSPAWVKSPPSQESNDRTGRMVRPLPGGLQPGRSLETASESSHDRNLENPGRSVFIAASSWAKPGRDWASPHWDTFGWGIGPRNQLGLDGLPHIPPRAQTGCLPVARGRSNPCRSFRSQTVMETMAMKELPESVREKRAFPP